jgi:hypothetical protein
MARARADGETGAGSHFTRRLGNRPTYMDAEMVATANDADKFIRIDGTLLPEHVEELKASGVTESYARANGLYSESNQGRLHGILKGKRPDQENCPAIVYPYRDATGALLFGRVKFAKPRINTKGEPKKYEQPRGKDPRAYILADVRPAIADPAIDLMITEGEKKTLCLNQHGFTTIGLSGVSVWQKPRTVILRPDLQEIAWKGRRVFILFDSDARTNDDVRLQQHFLALALIDQGATVYIVDLPGTDSAKVGADDFVVGEGAEALRSLIAATPVAVIPEVARQRYEVKRDEGSRPNLQNYIAIASDGGGEASAIPVSMAKIVDVLRKMEAGQPLRCGPSLFVDCPSHGIGFLNKSDALFGYFQSRFRIDWKGGGAFVSQAQLFEELRRTAPNFSAIERLPHFPQMPGCYYACQFPNPGSGETLRRLIARFSPSTTIDRDLLLAAFVTPFWGGQPGSRPAIVLTSDAGRGAGKTTAVKMISRLAGGHLAIEPGEDMTKMKQRFLSPEAVGIRVALIDNVKRTKFSWGELEALITTPVISGDKKYVGEAQRPNTFTWFVTINGVALSTDLAQRAVIIKLDKATYSGDWEDETYRFIDENRDALLADIGGFFEGGQCALLQASRWGAWERDVLCRLPEPSDAQKVILERQAECDADGDDGEMIDEYVGSQLALYGYDPGRDQVRIPNATLARWFIDATGEPMKTSAVTRRLNQMAREAQIKRLRPDSSRTYGRCYIYTGPKAQTFVDRIDNELSDRMKARQGY